MNSQNTVIEEATNNDLEFDDISVPNSYKLMSELHAAARRQALGVDQALDTLLESLSDEPGQGFDDFSTSTPRGGRRG